MLIDFILKEWLLIVSGVGLILTSIYTGHVPVYSNQEFQVLFILFVLFVSVNGLQRSGFISRISRSIEKGEFIPLKLVLMTFFMSMLVTNDVALIAIVPLTLTINISRKDILVIFEVLAANAGSALTPIGNPQNLFIYLFYDIGPVTFSTTIAPFSFFFLVILSISACLINAEKKPQNSTDIKVDVKLSYIYIAFLFVVIAVVFRVIHPYFCAIIIAFVLLADRETFNIDYSLLFSFLFFFGLAENMKILIGREISHSGHIFLFSALASQVISNVPATLLFAKFTTNWKALLWGSNTGGFGSLFGSLANLIAYKIYVTHESTNNTALFTAKFLIIGYMAFFLSVVIYFMRPFV
ncbi:SLC13 family permease [Geothermobacter hydrogeniphilus]|uniref:Citrate transporter-like domain-containing protein n=1 Tax=Geothermobacter hydrogeniphilus TaxID=1969733 RepID=A0A1X0Y8T4_9BACT|nr:SLC13 family permease [Geothermobacter hydrogeniphilus]ORJ61509.1 hypothetical protein B5V00_05580 [Geothermobacter hydrogeniphilus]